MARSVWQRLVDRLNEEYERRLAAASDLHPHPLQSDHAPAPAEDAALIYEQHRGHNPYEAGTVVLAPIERSTPPDTGTHPAGATPPTPIPAKPASPEPAPDDDEDGIEIANIPPGTRR